MKISIFTLTGQRDKFIDNLLADRLRKLGHEVIVRSYIYSARETVVYEKPDVIIHPMCGGQYKYDFVKQCKEWGIGVVVRRGEAGMGRSEFEKLDQNKKTLILGNWDYSPYVDLELVWGQEFGEILAEQGCGEAEKIKACGAFAFDPYFAPDCKRSTNHEKTILFATGFSTADCRSNYCECGLPEKSDYHKDIYRIHREARDKWLGAINKLVRWFGDGWKFELKVRPGEMEDEYRQKLPKCVKLHPQTSTSSEVLRDVDILVHSGSTLAIEAHLLGIPSFNFCNVNPDPLLAEVSPMVDSYEQLEWYLAQTNIRHSNINENVFLKLQEHLYGKIDGRACERAAGFIHEHIKNKKIKTAIPDVWPKTIKYLEKDIHTVKQDGDISFLCPCCRNLYYKNVTEDVCIARCPYCSMQIERTQHRAEAVLK